MDEINLKVFNMQQYKIENLDEMKAKVALLTNDIKRSHTLSEDKTFDVRLVITELLMNAFKHSKNDDSVDVYLDDDYSSDEIQITIEDNGEGFDVENVLYTDSSTDLYSNNGRGIKLVNALCSEVSYNNAGNSVSIVFKI